MSLDSSSEARYAEILDILSKNKAHLSGAMIGFTFDKRNDDLRPCYGVIYFLHEKDVELPDLEYDYDNYLIIRKTVSYDEATQFLSQLFTDDQILINDKNVTVMGNLRRNRQIRGIHKLGSKRSDWPYHYSVFSVNDEFTGYIGDELGTKLNYPVYPSGKEATQDIFDLVVGEYSDVSNNIEILIPDYRASIKNLVLSGKTIHVDITALASDPKDLITKFYIETDSETITSDEIEVIDSRSSFHTNSEPVKIEVHLFSKSTGEVLDKIEFNSSRPRSFEKIIIEDQEQQTIDLISRGETNITEFKRSLNSTNSEDFADTVVAFSNTYGGTIFIGVEDDGALCGYDEKSEDKIIDIISDYCNPRIEPIITSKYQIKDKLITIVRIREGTDPPYVHRKKGIRIRAGGTDRHINRVEIDDMYKTKIEGPLFRRTLATEF